MGSINLGRLSLDVLKVGNMIYLVEILISGIVMGSMYSLISLGLVIIYKPTRVLNFAHGDISMVGAYFGVQACLMMQLTLGLTIGLLIPFAFIVGGAIGPLLNIPLKQNRITSIVIASLSMGIVIQELLVLKFGAFPFYLPAIFPEKSLDLPVISIQYANLLIIAISVVVMLVMLSFFKFTKFGIAMRAVCQNREASLVMGINPTVVVAFSWGLASVIGMISCFLLSSRMGAFPLLGITVVIKAFTGAVIGGLTSLVGAVFGAFLVGIIDSLVGGYFSGDYQTIAAFMALLLILLLRPNGLFVKKSL